MGRVRICTCGLACATARALATVPASAPAPASVPAPAPAHAPAAVPDRRSRWPLQPRRPHWPCRPRLRTCVKLPCFWLTCHFALQMVRPASWQMFNASVTLCINANASWQPQTLVKLLRFCWCMFLLHKRRGRPTCNRSGVSMIRLRMQILSAISKCWLS